MSKKYDEEYMRLSAKIREYLLAGELDGYSKVLKAMAEMIHRQEGNHVDRMKSLMLAFYIDCSGCCSKPHIDDEVVNGISEAILDSGYDRNQVEELYLETVRKDTTPSHILTVRDTLYILELCIDGRLFEVLEIIRKLSQNA